MIRKVEKEIEFYKDIFGKIFTTFLLVATGTVTRLSQKGFDNFVITGLIASIVLFVSVLVTGYLYKRKVHELEV